MTLNPNSSDPVKAEERRNIVCKEEPLPELKEAISKLSSVFCEIMGFPKDYTTGLAISRIEISRTKHGTRAVRLKGRKNLDTIGGELHPLVAPFVKIDKPTEGESGDVLIGKAAVTKINNAIADKGADLFPGAAEG